MSELQQAWPAMTVPTTMDGWRFDRALATLFSDCSREQVRAAIIAGQALVEGQVCTKPRQSVTSGATVCLAPQPSIERPENSPEAIALEIVFEDKELLVINKPAELVVHPARGNRSGTLVNALAGYDPALVELPRCGLAHRLDKDTSGLIAVGRNIRSLRKLQDQFANRTAKRSYYALVHGSPQPTGVIERALATDPSNRLRQKVKDSGLPAITRFTLVEKQNNFALLQCRLETGRTHQIRVHLEYIGHPLAGDRVYHRYAKRTSIKFARQMLHAYQLELTHPGSAEEVSFNSKLPADFADALMQLGFSKA